MKLLNFKKTNFIVVTIIFIITLLALAIPVSTFSNLINKINFKEENTDDELTDNWELEIFFYNPEIDDGKTPLTEYNWEALSHDEERDVIIQINYKNSNTVTSYKKGELNITIPKLKERNGYKTLYDITAGTIEEGFEWQYKYSGNNIVLTNNIAIEPQTNFEGSIQLHYRPNPIWIENNMSQSIIATLSTNKATLSKSNEIKFNFNSKEKEMSVKVTANKVNGYDLLPEGAENYIWVRYHLDLYHGEGVRGVYVGNGEWDPYRATPPDEHALYFVTSVPEDAIVVDKDMEIIENDNGSSTIYAYTRGYYYIEDLYRVQSEVLVGYPKEKYQEEQLEYSVDVYGIYWDETETKHLCDSTLTIKAKDYLFAGYGSNLYWLSTWDASSINAAKTKKSYSATNNRNNIVIRYTGNKMDVELGNDVLIAPDTNGEYNQLTDSEYYFTSFHWYGDVLINSLNATIKPYNMEVWVRYANEEEFVLFVDNLEANKTNKMDFTKSDKKIVGWKVIIKDIEESILSKWSYMDGINLSIGTENIADTGYVYTSSYLKVFIDGELQNTATIDNYVDEISKNILAVHDQSVYGEYLRRATGKATIINDIVPVGMNITSVSNGQLSNNVSKEQFEGSFKINASFNTSKSTYDGFTGFTYYSLLPSGMIYESLSKMDNLAAIKSLKTKS